MSTTTPTLRDDQTAMVADTDAAWRRGARGVLCVAPTGAGKGELIRYWIGRAVAAQRPVLFVVHLSEILLDVAGRLAAAGLPAPRILMGSHSAGPSDALITLGSWQTLAARATALPVSLVIVDEAHRARAATCLAVLDRHRTARLLGFTATGQRGDGSGLGDVGFDTLVTGPSVADLVAAGHLAPLRLIAPDDYTDQLAWEPADAWLQHAAGRPGLVFASSLAHSRDVAAALQAAGVRAEHVDADTPRALRTGAIEALGRGELDAITNYRLFTEGVNVPRAAVCMLATAFSHDGPYLQSVGRVRRTHPDKPHATLIDLRGNRWRRGHPDAERVHSLQGEGCREALAPLPGCRQCPGCLSWVDGSPCPYCSAVTAAGRRPVRVVRAELHLQTAAREAARLARQDRVARSGTDWESFLGIVRARVAAGKPTAPAAFLYIKKHGRAPRWRVEHALEALRAEQGAAQ